mgnify:CR=1 FL=1
MPASLELGGCDAAYVHGDLAGDELHHAVEFIMTIGRLHNSGQSCCAVKRAFVHPDAYNAFVEIATERRESCNRCRCRPWVMNPNDTPDAGSAQAS